MRQLKGLMLLCAWTTILMIGLFMAVIPAAAQDSVIPPGVPTTEEGGALMLGSVLAIAAAFANSVLGATMVSLLKLFIPADVVSADILKNAVGVLLTVIYWLVTRYHFEVAFESVGQFLIVFVPAAITLYGSLVGSSMVHQQAVKHHVPLVNYQRTPRPQLE